MVTQSQIIEVDHVGMANTKGAKKTSLATQALLIELYYTGDRISENKLAEQFGLARSGVHEILQKYHPKKTDRDLIIVVLPQNGYDEKETPAED
jgi:hypothetical protein